MSILRCCPLLENLLQIGRAVAGCLGMVGSGGTRPAPCLFFHFLKEHPGIAGIAVGVEGTVQRGKCRGVVKKIDLHAAYINGGHTLLLKGSDGIYRFLPCGVIIAFSCGIDAPWPW